MVQHCLGFGVLLGEQLGLLGDSIGSVFPRCKGISERQQQDAETPTIVERQQTK